jgi:RNA polymerase sigma factor (TIGR02999 family)
MDEVATALLRAARGGAHDAHRKLEEATYAALRKLAQRRLARERAGHTLSATALVHEAYLRLIDQRGTDGQDRTHFLAVAALAMRRVLIDYARRRRADKRGGALQPITLDEGAAAQTLDLDQAMTLDRALTALEQASPRACRAICFRLFAGMTDAETAVALAVSIPTARRDLRFAQAWLQRELSREGLPL